MMNIRKNTSSREYLKKMPEWFLGNMVSRYLGIDEASAKVYLSRWKKQGLIRDFGERSRIYFNMDNLNGSLDRVKIKALNQIFPEAVLSGDSVLQAYGVITQIPRNIELTALSQRSFPKLEGYDIRFKPIAWFKKAQSAHCLINSSESESGMGFRELKPEWVLAEQIKLNTIMDIDDLYLDDLDRDLFIEACKLNNLNSEQYQEILEEFPDAKKQEEPLWQQSSSDDFEMG